MKVARQGVDVVETFGKGSDVPYKLWKADLYKCPECGTEVISGYGFNAYAEHFEADFAELLAKAEPKYWDKSC